MRYKTPMKAEISAEYIQNRAAKTQALDDPPDDPRELFDTEGFVEQKVNFVGRRLLDIEDQFTNTVKGLKNAIVALAILYLLWQFFARVFVKK